MQGVLTSLMLGDVAVPVNSSVPVNSWTPTDVIAVNDETSIPEEWKEAVK